MSDIFTSFFFIYPGQKCKCVEANGAKNYCGRWSVTNFDWCYLSGGPLASSCPGASPHGDLYWSQHPDICRGEIVVM